MNMKGRIFKTAFLALVVLPAVLALAVAASAETQPSTLSGPLGTFDLLAEVSQSGSLWTYTYTLTYVSGGPETETFSVGNPLTVAYSNALNTSDFTNPSYSPVWTEVKWTNGWMLVGDSVTFSFQSQNRPMFDMPVDCYAADGGKIAWGTTIGMSEIIPEPSSFAGLAIAVFGLAPKLLKKRR
jgi:hypothetical protein